jgi:CHAT domain-containing protein
MAGVKNLIVSLWQVPDKETAELMHSILYANCLQGNSVLEHAFYAAQKEMREKYAPYSMGCICILIE